VSLLRRGQRFLLGALRYRVIYVNASRAHCVATVRKPVTIRGRSFTAERRITIDISPNSAIDVLAETPR
jgi:hypothetical protein